MQMPSPVQQRVSISVPWLDRAAIIAAFVVSRILCLWLGVRMSSDLRLHTMFQILDVEELKNNLIASLYYLHAQPPLYNAFIGAVLKLFPNQYDAAFHIVFMITSLAGILCFHWLAVQISGQRIIPLALCALVLISPATILYENALVYEALIPWLLLIGFAMLWKFLTRDRIAWGMGAFLAFTAVVLIRTAFHPLWLVVIIAIALVTKRQNWRRILAASAPALLIVAALMAKNTVVFGQAGFSSWMGLQMLQQACDYLPPAERQALLADHKLSPLASVVAFSSPETYTSLLNPEQTITYGAKAIDSLRKADGVANLNAAIFLATNKPARDDALYCMQHYPKVYSRMIFTGVYHFFRPPSDFKHLLENLAHISTWDRIYSLVVWGQPAAVFGTAIDPARPQDVLLQPGYVSLLEMVVLGFSTLFFTIPWLRGRVDPSLAALLLSALATIAFIFLVANIFDTYETNRARFMIEPLIYLSLLGLIVELRSQRNRLDRHDPSYTETPAHLHA